MAFHQPSTNRASDGGLPEATPYQGLEHHVPSDQKQVHLFPNGEKGYDPSATELSSENWHINQPGVSANSQTIQPGPNGLQTQRERAWWKRKRFWIPLASLLLIGALAGGIGGGLSARHNSSSDKGGSTASPASTAAASPSSSGASSSTSIPAQPTPKPLNSSLASIAWSDHGTLGYRRLYYQDSEGTIKESAWNSSGNEWYSSDEKLGSAKPGSPIAAAVAGNVTWPFVSLPCLGYARSCCGPG